MERRHRQAADGVPGGNVVANNTSMMKTTSPSTTDPMLIQSPVVLAHERLSIVGVGRQARRIDFTSDHPRSGQLTPIYLSRQWRSTIDRRGWIRGLGRQWRDLQSSGATQTSQASLPIQDHVRLRGHHPLGPLRLSLFSPFNPFPNQSPEGRLPLPFQSISESVPGRKTSSPLSTHFRISLRKEDFLSPFNPFPNQSLEGRLPFPFNPFSSQSRKEDFLSPPVL